MVSVTSDKDRQRYAARRAPVRAYPAGARCQGFTYLLLLFLVAIVGATLVAIAQVWHTEVRREKERQLLFVGNQFRLAIASYYERAPGGARRFPKTFDDLLQDPRFPNVQRHLRQIYLDPITGKNEWGLLRAPDGGILGIHSLSEESPLKVAGFKGSETSFAEATSYKKWTFAYLPPSALNAQTAGRSLSGPGGSKSESDFGPPDPTREDLPELKELDRAAREASCLSQRSKDIAACSQAGANGANAAGSACLASASVRQQACLEGKSIPALSSR